MKGIILAGGQGTRLSPLTKVVSKQLLPIYNKPMIYYPLSVLMLAGIREILIISTPRDLPLFQELLGDGLKIGCSLSYQIQEEPNGLAEAFILGEEFIGEEKVALILGDNIFYGADLEKKLNQFINVSGAGIFGIPVKDPNRYGVIELKDGKIISIEEKPSRPKSNLAIPGIYFYDNTVVNRAKSLKPSLRGELEITDLNLSYLQDEKLNVETFGRGTIWLDTGTFDSYYDACELIRVIETRQNKMVACLEEIAFHKGFISKEQLVKIAQSYKNEFKTYLSQI